MSRRMERRLSGWCLPNLPAADHEHCPIEQCQCECHGDAS